MQLFCLHLPHLINRSTHIDCLILNRNFAGLTTGVYKRGSALPVDVLELLVEKRNRSCLHNPPRQSSRNHQALGIAASTQDTACLGHSQKRDVRQDGRGQGDLVGRPAHLRARPYQHNIVIKDHVVDTKWSVRLGET